MTYSAHAKLNLTLDILGKREDGYHNIESVMQTISLCDRLTFDYRKGSGRQNGIKISSSDPTLPTDGKNLCFRACELFFNEFGLSGITVKIHIEKNIPVGAGLGGGSSDCAATLKALNELSGINAPAKTLESLGGKLGADVPFFIKGGCRKAEGTGTELSGDYPLGDFSVAVAMPDRPLMTGEIYREFDEIAENEKGVFPKPSTEKFLNAKKRWKYVSNMLAPVSERKNAEIAKIKREFLSLGALASEMTGSGPTVFALFDSAIKAEKALPELKKRITAGFCGVFQFVKT
ncbi:MAG: 4-(cytidine 5'-diphospho)-2-C-methyl-D-erythritol kinase [Clostridia bacterium]|nr:4-(cytidine 5'-diphospho)-2-C-methyl-D-erythritol kinase [Clostridia bacterium]